MDDIVISAQGLAETYGNHWKKAGAACGIDLEVRHCEIFGKSAW